MQVSSACLVVLFSAVVTACNGGSSTAPGAQSHAASSSVSSANAKGDEQSGDNGHHGHMMHHGAPPDASNAGSQSDIDLALHRVAAVHGDAGPWAVAGFRMGKYALAKLNLSAYSFDLDIVHQGPRLPQYACVADGASASTGASIGKVNLTLQEADEQHVQTTYKRKSTGATVTLKPSASFVAKYKDLPREKLREAGREVMTLPDSEVFEEVR
ncbi:MAG: formylmethanofuran dehydrogenase subunit E family protein [Polyangiaceae bacterium]